MYKKCNTNKCIAITTDKIVILEENHRKFIANNAKQKTIIVYCIDKCLIDNRLACDYGVKVDKIFYFIELKGVNIVHACKQINATILYCNNKSYTQNTKMKAFIISTNNRVPKLKNNPEYVKLAKKVGKNNIKIKSRIYEINT